MRNNLIYFSSLPEQNWEEMIIAISSLFKVKTHPVRRANVAYYDTFDWRLNQQNKTLTWDGDRIRLISLKDHASIGNALIKEPPKFVAEFPEGYVKKKILSWVSIRALSQLFSVKQSTTTYSLIDNYAKTVARMQREDNKLCLSKRKFTPLISYLILVKIRGYDEESNRLIEILKTHGCRVADNTIYVQALNIAGNSPGKDHEAISQPAPIHHLNLREVIHITLNNYLRIMRVNIPGICQNIDSEFLHDFRVAIRRSRSLLGQFKSHYPLEKVNKMRRTLNQLTKQTNSLRDYQILLLNKSTYYHHLPHYLSHNLNSYFKWIDDLHAVELKKVTAILKAKTFLTILEEFEDFLELHKIDEAQSQNSPSPPLSPVSNQIFKRYKKAKRICELLNDKLTDSKFHQLRIELKKLRYMIEVFSPLYGVSATRKILTQLKNFQNHAGRLQDIAVQIKLIHEYIDYRSVNYNKNKRTLLALGCSLGHLENERRFVKHEFPGFVHDFNSPKTSKLYQSTFKSQ